MLVVSIWARADAAPIAKKTPRASALNLDDGIDFPTVGQLCFRLRYVIISGKSVANCAGKIGLKIEPVAAFRAPRRLFLPFKRPFCWEKTCTVSNGFLLARGFLLR
jgi:hypothetical protein